MTITTTYLSAQPVDDFGLNISALKQSATLATATDTVLTVPGDARRYKAVITVESGGDAWLANNQVAEVPAGATFASTTSELIVGGDKLAREVKANDVLHFITSGANVSVSVVFYAI